MAGLAVEREGLGESLARLVLQFAVQGDVGEALDAVGDAEEVAEAAVDREGLFEALPPRVVLITIEGELAEVEKAVGLAERVADADVEGEGLFGQGKGLVGEREVPDHPLVAQTLQDCLHEAMDLDGLLEVLKRIESGDIRCVTADLASPSPAAWRISTSAMPTRTGALAARRAPPAPCGVPSAGSAIIGIPLHGSTLNDGAALRR